MTIPQTTGSQDIGDLRSKFHAARAQRWLPFSSRVFCSSYRLRGDPGAALEASRSGFLGWLFFSSGVAALLLDVLGPQMRASGGR